jgi:hypothetical protein
MPRGANPLAGQVRVRPVARTSVLLAVALCAWGVARPARADDAPGSAPVVGGPVVGAAGAAGDRAAAEVPGVDAPAGEPAEGPGEEPAEEPAAAVSTAAVPAGGPGGEPAARPGGEPAVGAASAEPATESDAGPAAEPGRATLPEAAATAAPHREKLRWLVLPNVSYDSDDKFGLGARAEVVQPKAGVEPFKSSFVVHIFATTNGYHHHRFRFDLVDLGPKGRMRVTGHFAYRAWLNDGFWGVGNGTAREVAYDTTDPDDPDRKRYRYSLIQPFGQVAVRHNVVGPLSLFVSGNARYSIIQADPGSLLTEEQPLGMDGGLGLQVAGGVLWDTREPEVTPEKGWVLEGSARAVTGAYTFAGPFASARAWARLAPGVVLGQRVMGEWLFGDVPFYEMVHWGGSIPIAGFGGSDTLRGVSFGRWRAPGKAIANTELRIDLFRMRALKQELRWQIVPFADVGVVWGAGVTADAPPPAFPVHPAGGGGIRGIWGETMVGRVDFGVSEDLTDEGPAMNWGLYLMFDHMF